VASWLDRIFTILPAAMETVPQADPKSVRESIEILNLAPFCFLPEVHGYGTGSRPEVVTVCHNASLPHACTVLSLTRMVRHLRILWGRFL
jgi:hypothetical protein